MAKRGRPLRDKKASPYKDLSVRLNEDSIIILKQIQKDINGKYLSEAVNHVMENVSTINATISGYNLTKNMMIGVELPHFWGIIEEISRVFDFDYKEINNNIIINRNDRLYLVSLFGVPIEISPGCFAYPFCYLHFDEFKNPPDESAVESWNDFHPLNNIFKIRNNEFAYYKVFSFFGMWPTDQLIEELERFFDISDELIEEFGE